MKSSVKSVASKVKMKYTGKDIKMLRDKLDCDEASPPHKRLKAESPTISESIQQPEVESMQKALSPPQLVRVEGKSNSINTYRPGPATTEPWYGLQLLSRAAQALGPVEQDDKKPSPTMIKHPNVGPGASTIEQMISTDASEGETNGMEDVPTLPVATDKQLAIIPPALRSGRIDQTPHELATLIDSATSRPKNVAGRWSDAEDKSLKSAMSKEVGPRYKWTYISKELLSGVTQRRTGMSVD